MSRLTKMLMVLHQGPFLWFFQKLDYHRRWKKQVRNTSWKHYLSVVKEEKAALIKMQQEHAEWAEIKVRDQAIPVHIWLNVSPYICQKCAHIDLAGEVKKLAYQTVKFELANGELSNLTCLAINCEACGELSHDHQPRRGALDPILLYQRLEGSFGLSWEVNYGSNYHRERGVWFNRITHELVWERAEYLTLPSLKSQTPRPQWNLRVISQLKVDGVDIKPDHPQHSLFLDLAIKFEEGRMKITKQ